MPRVNRTLSLVLAWLLLLVHANVSGAPMAASDIPPALKPWIPWVLHGSEEQRCAFMHGSADQHQCAWPGPLVLEVNNLGGMFTQSWSIEQQTWITLPGGEDSAWPQEVTVNGRPGVTLMHETRPAMLLPAGEHHLQGRFYWPHIPESLPLPTLTGVLKLAVNKLSIAQPRRDADGNLWLASPNTRSAHSAEQDQMELQVFRRIVDDLPMQVLTRLHLRVAGAQREARIGPLGLADSLPLRLDSDLPARLDSDSSLRVLLRPGEWDITYSARLPGDTTQLKPPRLAPPWPAEEVWSYDAHPDLRAATVTGVAAVDPSQTAVPAEWQPLPAYRVTADDTFTLLVERRGNPEPAPDALHLQRVLWLDFDGKGYTVNDTLTGTMSKTWRLEAGHELKLGQVTVGGQPQLLTATDPKKGLTGIEVRHGTLMLTADSRLDAAGNDLPISGWRHDLHSLTATLHLPPGWRLFAASGVDSAPGTWLQQWSLLDFFLVLMTALAARKLWGTTAGGIALAALTLTWHAPNAPAATWLTTLATLALVRVLPDGRARSAAVLAMRLSVAALLLAILPFAISQIRTALYPQLEAPQVFYAYTPPPRMDNAELMAPSAPALTNGDAADIASNEQAASATEAVNEAAADRMESRTSETMRRTAPARKAAPAPGNLREQEADPDARIQTGPGLPTWNWHSLPLAWHGPVDQEQRMRLYLLPPAVNAFVNFLRVFLVLALLAYCVKSFPRLPGQPSPLPAIALLLSGILLSAPQPVDAAIPDAVTQEQLRNRLLAAPDCAPLCADSNRMLIDLQGEQLTVRMEINAAATTAIPVPGHAPDWAPSEILLDDGPAVVARRPDGSLWAKLGPGHHDLRLGGSLQGFTTLSLPLPLLPRRVEVHASGWQVEGVHEDGSPEAQLLFVRAVNPTTSGFVPAEPTSLTGYARVERTLQLRLNWQVTTHIQKLTPIESTVSVDIPLLPGESMLTPGLQVKNNRVLINLEPGPAELSWDSALPKSSELRLEAATTTAFVEVWRLDASTLWHVESQGLVPTQPLEDSARRIPQWRPWPGEHLLLHVSRPPGVAGSTLTLDSSQYRITPGQHGTDNELRLRIRSSQGGTHRLRLPRGAELQDAEINRQSRALRLQEDTLTLPITPGIQDIRLTWHEARGMQSWYTTPPLHLGAPSVNHTLELQPGEDRWTLLVGGPRLGPAVLFWGMLLAVALFASGLGRLSLTPLKARHWLLLSMGLTQTAVPQALLIVGWLLALGARGRMTTLPGAKRFNLIQIVLALLTLAALAALFESVEHGLLGVPDMQISGNNSTAAHLRWYQDRCGEQPASGWLLSVPFIYYRLLMLGWALWLATALLQWLRWGWICFTTLGLWQPLHWQRQKPYGRKEQQEPG